MAVIRPATPSDAAGIARVHVESWRTTYASIIAEEVLQALSAERREPMWRRIISQAEGFMFVAEEDGEIVGFVHGADEREGNLDYTGEVTAIYLLKQAQGRGLGQGLMQAAAREPSRRGHLSMLLWVLKDNTPARRFYEALGGQCLREKTIEIGAQTLIEVAYGWQDLNTLITSEA